MSDKKSKFERGLALANKEIKAKRAKIFTEDAIIDSENYMRELTDKKRELNRKLMNLEDFHADSTTTLKVTKDGFNSKQWIEDINETKWALLILNERIDLAESIHTEFFK